MTNSRKVLLACLVPVAIAGSLAVAASASAQDASNLPSQDKVVRKLADAGFTKVSGLKVGGNYWEGSGIRYGVVTRFYVAPPSNEVSGVDDADPE